MPATDRAPDADFKVVALIAAHNEGDIIGQVISDLIAQGVDVYLLDHASTDDTVLQAQCYLGRGLLNIERFPAEDNAPAPGRTRFVWEDILKRKESLAVELPATWFIHHDADELRESPWGELTLREAIFRVDRFGYNAIDFEVFNFWPTSDSFQAGDDLRRSFLYYEPGHPRDKAQIKCWKKTVTPVDLTSTGGHEARVPGRRVFPLRFILRHYPIRSQAHGERKVFHERRPRFLASERERGWHIQYDHIGPRHRFVRDPATLTRYDPTVVRFELLLRHREVERIEAAMGATTRQLSETTTALQVATAELQVIQNELSMRSVEVAALRARLEAHRVEMDEAHRRADIETANAAALAAALTGMRDTLAAMHASRRWRWTALLRAGYRLVGRLSATPPIRSGMSSVDWGRPRPVGAVQFLTSAVQKAVLAAQERRLSPSPLQWSRLLRTHYWELKGEPRRGTRLPLGPAAAALRGPGTTQLPPPRGYERPRVRDPYEAWISLNRWTPCAQEEVTRRLASARTRDLALPRLSIVMPVYDPPIEFLQRAIQSVVAQVYTDWELCIADDASTKPEIRPFLAQWARREPRIKLVLRDTNGNISRATNSAAALATGDFLLFLDQDDELTPSSLAEAALYVAEHPDTDFVYSDEDKIDAHGDRFAPHFKPGWSPELLLSYMYLGHFGMVRTALYRELGGFRVGFEGSQDHDFALRATERARHVGHIPLVLYHWRAIPGSTAVSGRAKHHAFEAGRRSVHDALARRGHPVDVRQPTWAVLAGAGIYTHVFPDDGPAVAIVVPTKNNVRMLRTCVASLARTTYRNFQLVIVNNDSDEPDALAFLQGLTTQGVIVLPIGTPPNRQGRWSFSYLNNEAVKRIDGEFVVFLNDDIEVREPRWLSSMVGYAQFHGVGAVGARLLYPDGRIQHAGVVHGLHHGLAGHAFKLTPSGETGYQSYAKVARNYSAVTAACMLTPRSLFLKLGGFDEGDFAVAYNDVDYCYRLLDAGYRCVYAPGAELTHHEGISRGFRDDPAELAAFRRKYRGRVDPYYSPHLSLADERFQIQPRRILRSSAELEPPLKLMLVTNALDFTGAPLHQYEIAVQLKRAGAAQPIVWCHVDGPLRPMYEAAGIPVWVEDHPLTHARGRIEAYDVAAAALGKRMRQHGINVVYANTLETFAAVEGARAAGIPSIWNVHESEPWQTYFARFGDAIAARALRAFEFPYRIVFVADATREAYIALNTCHNFTVIHNGLDAVRLDQQAAGRTRETARAALGLDADDIALLLLGTVCDRKGQLDLVHALRTLGSPWRERVRAYIVGDRPSAYSHRLHAGVDALPGPMRARVRVIPETGDTAQFYLAADIFLCTSRVESFPRVILEAMHFGLPILTTPVFGIREQVTDGVNGLFYEPARPDQLLTALLQLLADPVARTRFGTNARHVLQRLPTFEEMTAAYLTLFREAAYCSPHPSLSAGTAAGTVQPHGAPQPCTP